MTGGSNELPQEERKVRMNEGRRGFASPACSMHEVDPAYAG
jgi:hypothetical protein